jgi:hypothetical protein
MDEANSVTVTEEDVDNDDRKQCQIGEKERAAIFFAIRSTMVDGQVKRGIFSPCLQTTEFGTRHDFPTMGKHAGQAGSPAR